MYLLKRSSFVLFVLALGVAAGLFVSCGVKQTADPLSATNFKISESSSLHGGSGVTRSDYYYGETIYLTIDQLYPEWQTLVRVRKNGAKDCSCEECVSTMLVVTDKLGRIDDLEIWYTLGVDYNGNLLDVAGSYTVQILQTSQNNPWLSFKIPFTIIASPPVNPYMSVSNAAGQFRGNGVLSGQDVYTIGGSFAANTAMRIYVVKDKASYTAGDLYNDESGGFESATAAADGSVALAKIWPAATVLGAYDIVADIAPFGQYNVGDVVCAGKLAGLVIQLPSSPSDIIADVACDGFGNYKNIFTELEDVWAVVNPTVRPAELVTLDLLCHSTVYVSPHKAVWNKNDPLVHIETVGSMHSAIEVLVDPTSGSLGLTLVRGESKAGYRQPLRLWPGDYDMIVDVNNNSLYDPGIDILDGGPQVGFTVPGVTPPVILVFYALPDYQLMDKTLMRAVVLRSDHTPVVGATVYFNVGKGPGQVAPTSGVTDSQGMTHTYFWGAEQGQWSIIRALVTVDGVQYVARISVWGDMCQTHNQGVVIGG